MAPIFCCGGECGLISAGSGGQHWDQSGSAWTISTTTVRNGARSLRFNVTAGTGTLQAANAGTSTTTKVWRDVIRFASLPSVDCILSWQQYGSTFAGIGFKASDSKIYAATDLAGVTLFGATGVAVTTGVWYVVDAKTVGNVVTGTVDVRVGTSDADMVACGQQTGAFNSANATTPRRGSNVAVTVDAFFEDFLFSETSGDYPFGDGHVDHFVPTADGTHNVAGVNDFERTLTGTDIDNTTTTAFQLVDDVPLDPVTAPPVDFINMIAPPNATDYVECIFGPAPGISTPTTGPRMVQVIATVAQSGTGLGNMEIRLNDNGTTAVVYTATGVAGIVNGKVVSAGFADPPSAATVWNAAGDGGNGDFLDLRVRFGSPAALDVNPDQYFGSIMIEAEFAAVVVAVAVLDAGDDEVTAAVAADAVAQQLKAITDQIVAQTVDDDYGRAPPSGALPVLERPDEDETAEMLPLYDNAPPTMLISDGFAAALAEAALSEEWLPVSGATPVLERPDEDDDRTVDWIAASAWLIASGDSAVAQSIEDDYDFAPPSGATPVLERPDEDVDEAQLWLPLPLGHEIAIWMAAESEVIPVSGAAPVVVVDNPAEDEDPTALFPALDTSFDVALLASVDEIAPSGATLVLERPDDDEDGAQYLPGLDTSFAAALQAVADAEVIPVSGAAPVLDRPDEDEDGAQLLPPLPSGHDIAIEMAAGDEVRPVSGATPVLERADEDDDYAAYQTAIDTSFDVAHLMATEESLPVDGTVVSTGPMEDEEPAALLQAPDSSVAVAHEMAVEVLPASGAAPVLERADEDEDGVQLWPPPPTNFEVIQSAIEQGEALPGAIPFLAFINVSGTVNVNTALAGIVDTNTLIGGEIDVHSKIGGSVDTNVTIAGDVDTHTAIGGSV